MSPTRAVALWVLLAAVGCGDERASGSADAGAAPDAREPVADAGGGTGGGVDILWIGAHPDDEMTAAPILGAECVDADASCALLVLTRGEAGHCKRPALCAEEELVTVRARELESSAALFGARLEVWDLGDGNPGDAESVLGAWADRVGTPEGLLGRMVDALRELDPTTVYTFDPRHGSTCHPDHRATAALVLLAAQELGAEAPTLRMIEAIPDQTLAPDAVGFTAAAPGDPALVRFDATAHLDSIGGEAWQYTVRVLELHETQFTDEELDAVRSAPAEQRATYWVDVGSATADDPLYTGLCTGG